MDLRVLLAAPAMVLLWGCASVPAAVSRPDPAASSSAIPWIDTKPSAYHEGLAVPVGQPPLRACKPDDLTATYAGAMGLTNGQMTGTIDLANVSSTACVLDGAAAVDLFGAKGATLSISTYSDTRFTAVPVVLQPAGRATIQLDWSQYDEAGDGTCAGGLVQAAAMNLTLPGGGTVTTSAVSPRNDGPITFCPPRIGVGAFQASLPADATAPVAGHYFEATLNVPSTGRAGHALNYQVTLKSVFNRPLSFPNGCPGYLEDLAGPSGWTLGKTWYVLNCQPMGAVIAPGASFTFAMVVQIPASAPVGDYSLAWGIDAGDSNNNALSASFTVVPG